MKRMNQYSTPMERIDDNFRARLEAERYRAFPAVPAETPQVTTVFDPGDYPQAMVYAPESTFTDIYGDEDGLSHGTIFRELYFPFDCAACRGAGGMRL